MKRGREGRSWRKIPTGFLIFIVLGGMAGCAQRTAYHDLESAIKAERSGNAGAALAAFRSAVKVCPDDPYLRRMLGQAYLRRRMFAKGIAELEKVLELEPNYADAYRDLALAFEAQQKPDTAAVWLEKGIRKVPDYAPLYQDLVDVHLEEDRPDEAMALLERAVRRWPNAVWAHMRLGHLYQQLKLNAKAVASFRRVVGLAPNTPRAYASLGNALYAEKKYGEAAKAYRKAIELNPRDHSSLNNLAWVYALQGTNLEEGIRLSRRSLRLSPDSPTYLDTLAELYYKQGEYEQAVQIIHYAISLQPDDPELMGHLQKQLKKFMAAGQGKV